MFVILLDMFKAIAVIIFYFWLHAIFLLKGDINLYLNLHAYTLRNCERIHDTNHSEATGAKAGGEIRKREERRSFTLWLCILTFFWTLWIYYLLKNQI